MSSIIVTDPDLLKSHVKGHYRNGQWVSGYDNKVVKKPGVTAPQYGMPGSHASHFNSKFGFGPSGGQGSLFSGSMALVPKGPPPKPKGFHPKLDDAGKKVGLYHPHIPNLSGLYNPKAIATFTPGQKMPAELNGIPFAPWADAPTTDDGWENVAGQKELDEPPMHLPPGIKDAASGLIIAEPDGRVWVVSPSNRFGGYKNTFPKGKVEGEMSFQANALKEAYEEAGLKCRIVDFVGDVKRTTSVCRYYLAVREGGSPAECGWESQAVHLVPGGRLRNFLDAAVDRNVVAKLAAL